MGNYEVKIKREKEYYYKPDLEKNNLLPNFIKSKHILNYFYRMGIFWGKK